MSKRQFKSQASSGRVGNALVGFGSNAFGSGQSSTLSYVQEPTDLSAISDPNVAVAVKNLTKKDGTTKAKALEDLQAHVATAVEIEDGLLEAWAKLFPRLAVVDNTRRVRQLTHMLNGQICSKCGKRTVKHMPRIAGPWLAGTFDTDRAVARAASESLNQVFNTPEKVLGVKKTFQRSILEYSRDAALHETVQTLSDERTVSIDDAKATHARVVATSLWTVQGLMIEVPRADRAKEADIYEELLHDQKIWALVYDPDASVRRAMDRLVQTCIEQQVDLIENDLKAVSKAFVYQGLHSDQTSSALEFLQTLERLTTQFPTIWTEEYSGKRPAISRLRHFVKQGSQGAAATFWETLAKLLERLPRSVLPSEESDIADLLSALRSGVCKKEERFNASTAWPVYFSLANLLISWMSADAGKQIAYAHVLPLVKQYLDPAGETSDWSIGSSKASALIARTGKLKHMDEILSEEWPLQADRLIELAKVSQPEQAKDFDKSQKHVATNGERFADLQRELWASTPEAVHSHFRSSSRKIISECIAILESRNGRPYGAAAMIESLLRTLAHQVSEDQDTRSIYLAFAKQTMPSLVFGPSQRHLLHGLYALHDDAEFPSIFDGVIESVVKANEAAGVKLEVVRTAFTPTTTPAVSRVALANQSFQDFIAREVYANRSPDASSLLASMVKAGVVQSKTIDQALSQLTESLSVHDQEATTLSAIDTLWSANSDVVRGFMAGDSPAAGQLIPNVVKLEQSADDDVAERATALSSKLSSAIDGSGASHSKFSVILQSLETTSASSLSMDSVNDLVDRFVDRNIETATLKQMIPSLDLWKAALGATMRPPRASLALTSPLGGVVHLIDAGSTPSPLVHHDAEGLSQGLRISMYLAKLFSDTGLAEQLDADAAARIHALLYATVVLAEDNLSISGSNSLWRAQDENVDEVVLEFISHANNILNEYFKGLRPSLDADSSTGYAGFTSALHSLKSAPDTTTPASYCAALSSARAHDTLCEMHGSSSEQSRQAETIIRERRSAKDTVGLAAAIAGFRQSLVGSQLLNRYCNELVADLTDLDVEGDTRKGLQQLILLNVVLGTQEDGIAVVTKQRRIFLIKRLLLWLGATPSPAEQGEICRTLNFALEGIDDIYGEHWEQAIAFITEYWNSCADESALANDEQAIAPVNASLRLLHTLRKLSKSEEPNDDLVDALKDKEDQIRDALVKLLMSAGSANDEHHQPLQLTLDLLARQLAAMPFKPIKGGEDLFPLLYAPSRAVMQAAFNLLHAQIPTAQEQISFDAALDNKTAELPDELLSLLLEAPTLDSLAEASFNRMMPLALQSYLYSWRSLFDHFENSSYRVKNDYVEQLKDGSYLTGLLDLIFDFLGHTRGRPVDASKFDVREYTPDVEPSPEKDVQWLLAHLYFLALTNLPSLVKSYYLDIRSRQTSQAIDSWTAKYISPLVIRTSLEAVDEWSKTSVKEDPEYEKMAVKVGMRSREINVSYVVDEQTMAIKVVLPEAYPLASAQVAGVSRVAVKEEKWQSWLRNCQGVITFSNGSITDGLAAWRRNVTGALKGQTECAICYSIISADKQLPTKRCPTCRYLFHSSCLFKWFKSSNASTCPLCRNAFNFN